jgi:hypothetical protein
MTRRCIDLHGTFVEVDDRLAAAPSLALLGGLPDARVAADPALTVTLRPTAERRALPADARPSFFHGAVRAATRAGEVLLGDGASLLEVSADGRHLDGDVHAESLASPEGFAHSTLLLALAMALRHHRLFHLHAGASITPGGAPLLVVGDAGAGKSTVVLALAAAGCAYLGDDTVLLGGTPARPRLHALPRRFHIAPATAAAFPEIAPLLGDRYGDAGKRLLDAARALPGKARLEAGPPCVVLLPRVAGGAVTSFERVPAAAALEDLVLSSALVAVDGAARAPEHLALLGAVVDGAVALRVALGRDLLLDPGRWAARALEVLAAAAEGGRDAPAGGVYGRGP